MKQFSDILFIESICRKSNVPGDLFKNFNCYHCVCSCARRGHKRSGARYTIDGARRAVFYYTCARLNRTARAISRTREVYARRRLYVNLCPLIFKPDANLAQVISCLRRWPQVVGHGIAAFFITRGAADVKNF